MSSLPLKWTRRKSFQTSSSSRSLSKQFVLNKIYKLIMDKIKTYSNFKASIVDDNDTNHYHDYHRYRSPSLIDLSNHNSNDTENNSLIIMLSNNDNNHHYNNDYDNKILPKQQDQRQNNDNFTFEIDNVNNSDKSDNNEYSKKANIRNVNNNNNNSINNDNNDYILSSSSLLLFFECNNSSYNNNNNNNMDRIEQHSFEQHKKQQQQKHLNIQDSIDNSNHHHHQQLKHPQQQYQLKHPHQQLNRQQLHHKQCQQFNSNLNYYSSEYRYYYHCNHHHHHQKHHQLMQTKQFPSSIFMFSYYYSVHLLLLLLFLLFTTNIMPTMNISCVLSSQVPSLSPSSSSSSSSATTTTLTPQIPSTMLTILCHSIIDFNHNHHHHNRRKQQQLTSISDNKRMNDCLYENLTNFQSDIMPTSPTTTTAAVATPISFDHHQQKFQLNYDKFVQFTKQLKQLRRKIQSNIEKNDFFIKNHDSNDNNNNNNKFNDFSDEIIDNNNDDNDRILINDQRFKRSLLTIDKNNDINNNDIKYQNMKNKNNKLPLMSKYFKSYSKKLEKFLPTPPSSSSPATTTMMITAIKSMKTSIINNDDEENTIINHHRRRSLNGKNNDDKNFLSIKPPYENNNDNNNDNFIDDHHNSINNNNNDNINDLYESINHNIKIDDNNNKKLSNLISPKSMTIRRMNSIGFDDPDFKYRNITAQVGHHAYMPCNIDSLGDKMVSWIRLRDFHLLTIGTLTYIQDDRFIVRYDDGNNSGSSGQTDNSYHNHRIINNNDENDQFNNNNQQNQHQQYQHHHHHHNHQSNDWILQIKHVTIKDEGLYECQINTDPPKSQYFYLHVVVPFAEILGNPNIFVRLDETINLTCLIIRSPEPPAFVFWYHNERMINYDYTDTNDGRIIMIQKMNDQNDAIVSRLIINKAKLESSGNYTCSPSNAEPASTYVHVLQGEKRLSNDVQNDWNHHQTTHNNILLNNEQKSASNSEGHHSGSLSNIDRHCCCHYCNLLILSIIINAAIFR